MTRLLAAGLCVCLAGCELLSEEDVDLDLDGYTSNQDCDDTDPNVHPGAPELCDNIDQDCDGETSDSDAVDAEVYHPDLDSDGRGDPEGQVTSCTQPENYVVDATDCDDTTPRVSPDVAEICDGLDNDCDGQTDEDDARNAPTWHKDSDSDGFGNPDAPGITTCNGPLGHADNGDDCNDNDPEVHPDAEETWYDGIDQDCDEWSDFDIDRDGYDASNWGGTDCDDLETEVNPGADEVCNDGIDNDCDGTTNHCGLHGEISLGLATTQITGEESRDQIGNAIAAAGDVDGDGHPDLLVDAQFSDLGGDNSGAAYLIRGPLPSGELGLEDADAVLVGEFVEDQLGTVLAGVGDLNEDGMDDLLLTATHSHTGGTLAGTAYLVLGPISGTVSLVDADAQIPGNDHGMFLGRAAAAISDVDDDGGHDLALGAPGGGGTTGLIAVVSGASTGVIDLDLAALSLLPGIAPGDGLGTSLAAVDLTGDGFTTLVAGAPGRAPGGSDATGVVYGFNLPLVSDPEDADWTVHGIEDGDLLGITVTGVGDLDGDGHPDLVFGASGSDDAMEDAGAAYIFLGGLDGDVFAWAADAVLLGGAAGDALGAVVSPAGDLDSDGLPDLALGAPTHSPDSTLTSHAGRVYIFSGDVRGTISADTGAESWVNGEASDDEAGHSMATLGDTNDDGYDDLLIGAPYHDAAGPNAGAVYLLLGGEL